MMLRIEAGLPLIDVEWHNSRLAFTDHDRVTPKELGMGWMLRGVDDDDRAFVGRDAIRRELAERTSRWASVGIVVDWQHWDRLHRDAGLLPPKDEHPLAYESMLYDRRPATRRSATSPASCTPPCCSATSAWPGCGPTLAAPGTAVHLEIGAQPPQHHGARRAPRGCPCSTPRGRRPDAHDDRDNSTTAATYDAIVVGGGHNGLVNAGYLAKAGLRTLVLERRHLVGGAAITEELRAGLLVHDVLLRAEPAAAGDHPRARPGQARLHAADDAVVVPPDRRRRLPAARRRPRPEHPGDPRHSPHDADAYDRYHHDLDRVCQAIQPLFDNAAAERLRQGPRGPGRRRVAARPPRRRRAEGHARRRPAAHRQRRRTGSTTTSSTRPSRASTPRRASSARRSGRCRRAPGWCCCSTRWASTTATSARGRSTRAATAASPRCSPGPPRRTAPRSGSAPGRPRASPATAGPSASRSRTAPSSARRSWSRALDPRRTFLDLVDPRELPGDLVENVERMRFRGVSAKVNFALDGLPVFPALPRHRRPLRRLPQHRPDDRVRRAGLRRREVRLVQRAAVHRRARSSRSSTPTWRRPAST